MSIDLSQFHQVFFEESFEGLDEMESSLMALDPAAIDSETINSIFRAAHSIKGGSATFGFSHVAEFTHVLETLLDEIRDGRRGISQDDVDLFLQSVDCMREMLTALQSGGEPPAEQAASLKVQFEAILNGTVAAKGNVEKGSVEQDNSGKNNTETSTHVDDDEISSSAGQGGWEIDFKPGPDLLRTGNDPIKIFRELSSLGDLSADVSTERVPDFASLDPEQCFFDWLLTLTGDSTQEQVGEVFEWVEDDADIQIKPLAVNLENENTPASTSPGWEITFVPGTSVFKTGNEPLRLLRELAELGTLSITSCVDNVPEWTGIEPESCYLSWVIRLQGETTEDNIKDVFEWVADESDIQITALAVATPAAKNTDENSRQSSRSVDIQTAENNILVPLHIEMESQPIVSNSESIAEMSVAPADVAKAAKSTAPKSSTETSSIRVGIDKIDNLINMVGELVITQSMLGELGTDFVEENLPKLMEGLSQLEQNTRELQESVMRIRMLPISFAFSRFPRMVRDLSRRLEKRIHLELLGEQTELDKTVMEKIGDPLVHLVRNAVDHGIETPAERRLAGKPEEGRIVLNAYHQGGNVVIEIDDDGKGLNREKLLAKAIEKKLVNEKDVDAMSDEQVFDLIFAPGFSTATEVSDVSGRGVGMDVVRRNIQELNGAVEINSRLGKGSKITIRLPLTLAILDGQLVRVGSHTYIFPLISIVESLQLNPKLLNRIAGGCDVFQLRNEYVPIINLYEIFDIIPDSKSLAESLLVVVECEGEKVGVVVDDLLAQQQVVIKSLEQNYRRVEGVSGATILGDGRVSLILDIPGLVKLAGVRHHVSTNVAGIPLANYGENRTTTH